MNHGTTEHLAPRRARRSPRPGSLLFLAEALRDMRTTGAVAPSGRRLARRLSEPLRTAPAGRPLTVLEAGAGTGSVTRVLLPLLGPGCRLDIAEANPRFAARLRSLTERAAAVGPARPHLHARISVHETRVEHLDTGRRYDAIVSGLPFANFTPAQVETIMERYLALLRPGGTLTYFAYVGTGAARGLLASRSQRAHRARQRAVEDLLAGYRARCRAECRIVAGNLPPARVWSLRTPGVAG